MSEENLEVSSPQYPESRTPADRIAGVFANRFWRASWLPAEIVSAAVVSAVLIFAVAEVASGIIIGVGEDSVGIAETLITSAAWSEPILVAALLGSALLCWREVSECSDDLEFFANSDDNLVASEILPEETLVRLCRSRLLSTGALAGAVLATAASIAREVGIAMEQLPHGTGESVEVIFNTQTLASLIGGTGLSIAVIVLTFACAVVAQRICRQVRAALALSESDDVESDIL